MDSTFSTEINFRAAAWWNLWWNNTPKIAAVDEFCVLVVPTTALMVLVCICACRCKTVFACFSFFLIIVTFHAPLPLHYFHIPTMFSRVLKMLYYYHFSCYEASELEVNENFIIVGKRFPRDKKQRRQEKLFSLL